MITVVFAITVAAILVVGFVIALIFALIRTARYDSDQDLEVGDRKIGKIPSLDIRVNSKDIRYMDSSQITQFFRGIKQSLVEYRKGLNIQRRRK